MIKTYQTVIPIRCHVDRSANNVGGAVADDGKESIALGVDAEVYGDMSGGPAMELRLLDLAAVGFLHRAIGGDDIETAKDLVNIFCGKLAVGIAGPLLDAVTDCVLKCIDSYGKGVVLLPPVHLMMHPIAVQLVRYMGNTDTSGICACGQRIPQDARAHRFGI